MADSNSWKAIFDFKNINSHDFDKEPYILDADDIKKACQNFTKTSQKEVRILCKQDSRKKRPDIFVQKNLFILPKKNGSYYIIKGEGYVDIPDITTPIKDYVSKLDFDLISSGVGDSEMQYLDFAYANSLIRTFMEDRSCSSARTQKNFGAGKSSGRVQHIQHNGGDDCSFLCNRQKFPGNCGTYS